MHTLQALKLIGEAVRLSEAGFEGDCLAKACSQAGQEDREAVGHLIRSLVWSGHQVVMSQGDLLESLKSRMTMH